MAEAQAYLTRGLGLAARLPDAPERRLRESELQLASANVQMPLHGFGSAAHGSVLARALSLCRGLDAELPERTMLLSRALYGEWSNKMHSGSLQLSHSVATEFVELSPQHRVRLWPDSPPFGPWCRHGQIWSSG